jgi:hypothetical protein
MKILINKAKKTSHYLFPLVSFGCRRAVLYVTHVENNGTKRDILYANSYRKQWNNG